MKRTGAVYAFISLIFFCAIANGARDRLKMDFDWKFQLNENVANCSADAFPINMDGVQCFGLSQANADTADECSKACCSDEYCETWQWCPPDAKHCTPVGSCWVGARSGCMASPDWISRGRNSPTPPTNNTKCTVPFCMPDFDDKSWRTLDIPHDFVVEGKFSPKNEESHAFLPKGVAWYRKHFTLDTAFKGQTLWIDFDGVYRESNIWLNGYFLGNHPSGYTSFRYYITDIALFGEENVLAVRADSTHDEGWWYEGGGIYRHVWLNAADPVHVEPWGIYASSEITGSISPNPSAPTASAAVVKVETKIVNERSASVSVQLVSKVLNDKGQTVGQSTSSSSIQSKMTSTISQNIELTNVNLWHITSPYLYTLVSTVLINGQPVDEVNTNIGIRRVIFDNNKGLYLNDLHVKVYGFCNHQDFAGVGTAVPDRINEFRVQKLQSMGANGWRMSHNPPNPELLDFTDRYGMLVWDENRNFGNTSQYLSDVATLPLRDRNHPSIIIWSLCNEFGCSEGANDSDALGIAQQLKAIITKYDATRPISAAWNSNLEDLLWGWGPKVMDLQGVNYNEYEIDPYHAKYPSKPMIQSETASCTGARGIYVTNATDAHESIFSANGCVESWWTIDATTPFLAGGFAWTGFDYKGEPTPYGWPCVNSNFGTIDLAGFPKDTFWYYKSWWTNETTLHVFPHWNQLSTSDSGLQAGSDQVWAYSNADSLELFLNGVSQGKQQVPYLKHVQWSVKYAPGTIEVRAYDKGGSVIAKESISTTGEPAAIILEVEYPVGSLYADRQDAALITGSIVDAQGRVVPTAANFVSFSTSGPGSVVGVGNGDPSCHEPDRAASRSAFNGLVRAVLQVTDQPGTITITATSPGLKSGSVQVTSVKPPQTVATI